MKLEVTISPKSLRMLKTLHKDFRESFIDGLKKAMFFAERQAKRSFGDDGKPAVRTGHLRRTVKGGVKVRNDVGIGYLSANTIYAAIHELGGIIRPTQSEYLKFQIGGQWKQVKQVTMPERPYLEPAITDNINKIEDIIKAEILTQMNKP